ncbi:MAG: NUDIX hydrolase [Sulfurovum sp.]|nr:NUDIX hydrolase [Sulfurovum sp.]
MKSKITNFRLEPLKKSHFIQTALACYEQCGIAKNWEVVEAHDSVAILLYHLEKKAFILVKQFRPAVYLNNEDGNTVELCAGIIDKDLPLIQIAIEEIEEECGYRVPLNTIERVTAFHTSVGFAGSKQTLYYAEVNSKMQVSNGGGIDDELIEVLEVPVDEMETLIYNESVAKTPGLMFAFMWWKQKYT